MNEFLKESLREQVQSLESAMRDNPKKLISAFTQFAQIIGHGMPNPNIEEFQMVDDSFSGMDTELVEAQPPHVQQTMQLLRSLVRNILTPPVEPRELPLERNGLALDFQGNLNNPEIAAEYITQVLRTRSRHELRVLWNVEAVARRDLQKSDPREYLESMDHVFLSMMGEIANLDS